ncbi:MAG: cytochrome P450 [Solirubrobacteraceae bacterium]
MAQLPPGPRAPAAVQTLAWWTRAVPYFERNRARFGDRWTLRLLGTPPFVMISDPEEVKAVFQAAPDVLHPGEGARLLEPVVGANSLILLDEDAHLRQRRLMLPAFHGDSVRALAGLMTAVAEREVASWPKGEPIELHPRMQALTLEIILRTVFGLDEGERLDALRARFGPILELGGGPFVTFPPLRRSLGPRSPWARFVRLRGEVDELIFQQIEERRAEPGDRDDVLALLLRARDDAGAPMTDQELRDELMTMLVAGHETTASELAWAVERLLRTPAVLARLTGEVRSGDDDAYLAATVNETLRRRPVLANAEPRLTMREVRIGDWTYPEGVVLGVNAYLVHHDPAIYPDPYAFRPERFLDQAPGTYTFLPFGGGRRRCIGAAFATAEMKVVLRTLLEAADLRDAGDGRLELSRRRNITLSPGRGARALLAPA